VGSQTGESPHYELWLHDRKWSHKKEEYVPRFDRLEFEPSPERQSSGAAPAEVDRDERYWLRLADENRRQGLYENALRYYSRALELDRSQVVGWVGQVQMLILLGEYTEAELWSRKALELFRNYGDLLAGRAQALSRLRDPKQAHPLCDASLRQPGVSAYRWLVRGELMLAGKQEVERHCFDKAVQLDPDWLVLVEVALVYQHHRLPSKALERLRQAVEKAPSMPYGWFLQGCCEQDLGLLRPARASLARCLELVPGHVQAQQRLAKLDKQGGSWLGFVRRLLGRSFAVYQGVRSVRDVAGVP
jgi:tetratricopeptide (TPR) repeat protein